MEAALITDFTQSIHAITALIADLIDLLMLMFPHVASENARAFFSSGDLYFMSSTRTNFLIVDYMVISGKRDGRLEAQTDPRNSVSSH